MLKEKFRMELHFDNEYSAQAFHFDSVPSDAMLRALDRYLGKKRLRAAFGEDGGRRNVCEQQPHQAQGEISAKRQDGAGHYA